MSTVNSTTNGNQVIQQLTQGTSTAPSATEDMGTRFLTLLTTQLKNQDPLNPMDNAEMTSQLAQINTVNGIEKLNVTMQKLLGSYSDSMSMQSSALIGKNILAAGNKLSLGENGALGGVNLDGPADQVKIVITDAAGKKIAEELLGAQSAGTMTFQWDGKDVNGNAVPPGNYNFSVEAVQANNKVSASALQYGTVSALVRTANGFQLEVPTLGQIDFNAVQQIF